MAVAQAYLGQTIKFPIEINVFGRPNYVNGVDTIPEAIRQVLMTAKASRFFLPDYGSDIMLLIFEPNDDILQNLLYYNITNALEKWEKRIKVLDVEFKFVASDSPRVDCIIHYQILKSNEVDSFVFPFYKELIY